MSAEVSFTKRAAAEISRCFNGITVSRQSGSAAAASSSSSSSSPSSGVSGPSGPASGGGPSGSTLSKCGEQQQQQQQQQQHTTSTAAAALSNSAAAAGAAVAAHTGTLPGDSAQLRRASAGVLPHYRSPDAIDHLSRDQDCAQFDQTNSGAIQCEHFTRSNRRMGNGNNGGGGGGGGRGGAGAGAAGGTGGGGRSTSDALGGTFTNYAAKQEVVAIVNQRELNSNGKSKKIHSINSANSLSNGFGHHHHHHHHHHSAPSYATTFTQSPQQQQQQQPKQSSSSSSNSSSNVAVLNDIHLMSMNGIASRRPSRNGPPPKAPPKTTRARRKNYLLNLNKPLTVSALFGDPIFLRRFFAFVCPIERCTLTQVCKTWCHVLYDDSRYWKNLTFVIYYNQLRQQQQLQLQRRQQLTTEATLLSGIETSQKSGHNDNFSATEQREQDSATSDVGRNQDGNENSNTKQSVPTDGANWNGSNSSANTNRTQTTYGYSQPPQQQQQQQTNLAETAMTSEAFLNSSEIENSASNTNNNSYVCGNKWPLSTTMAAIGSAYGETILADNSSTANVLYAQMMMMSAAAAAAAATATGSETFTAANVILPPATFVPTDDNDSIRARLYQSVKRRGFDSVRLHGATDSDIIEFTSQAALMACANVASGGGGNDCSGSGERFSRVSIQNSVITDKGLEVFLAAIARSLKSFELIGCNEVSDSGLWTGLVPNLKSLTIQDCINVSDETIAAICQLLTSLDTLHVQAYHVTDSSMAFFSTSMLRDTLRTLVLQHCWEITNQGVVNLAHSLPNLTSLSLSGCSKVTDEAIEVIAEQLRNLKLLDLSWCPRISDAALEYIACDLAETLNTLVLDRCLYITDIGLGYIATMTHLENLSVRWCPQIRDFGLQALISLRSLRTLSIAGCSHVSLTGLSFLVRMQQLEELELTNCTPITKDLVKYLAENLTNCVIVR